MADDIAFKLIDERPVGKLPASIVKRGAALEARKDELEAALKKLRADIDELDAALKKRIPKKLESDAQETVRIGDDGVLYQVMCQCLECQAKLNDLSVKETAEAMIAARLVPADRVEWLREHAEMLTLMANDKKENHLLYN